jgi:hypothetical protein
MRAYVLLILCVWPSLADADLLAAYRRGDRAAMARHAQSMGAEGLARTMLVPDRLEALAALTACPHASDAITLLDELALRAAEPDRDLALAAVKSAVAIASTLDSETIHKFEVPPQSLRESSRLWSQLALQPGRHADVRVLALEVAAAVQAHVPATHRTDLEPLFRDPDPQIAYSALLLTHTLSELDAPARSALKSPSPALALGAGQRLCGPVGSPRKPPPLDEAERSRLRKLALDRSLELIHRLDLAPCLALDAKAKDALRHLQSKAPAHLRAALSRLKRK